MNEVDRSTPVEKPQLQPVQPPTPPVKPSWWLKIVIVGGIAGLVLILVGSVIYLVAVQKSSPKEVACTQEAKQCPDGSWVSRSGPNCDFAPCPTSTPDETANWETWKDNKLNYEFKYPSDWEVGDSEFGSPTSVIQQLQKNYYLVISYISQSQLSVRGITYCGAHPDDVSRCELSKINEKTSAEIDWGTADNERPEASVQIGHPKGGIITFVLSPVNSETKSILYKILSTFKFTQ